MWLAAGTSLLILRFFRFFGCLFGLLRLLLAVGAPAKYRAGSRAQDTQAKTHA
jgi:hypothetical protein